METEDGMAATLKGRLAAAALLAIAGFGCTVDKKLTATGGSRADGVVELSYEIGGLENARIDWTRADTEALQRCQAWGYQSAEKFGGEKRQCNYMTQYGCNQ